jgi:ATP-dependent RNA helicase
MSSPKMYLNFDDMPLNENLLRGLYAAGFEKPSKPQKIGIVPAIEGKDLLLQSQSGTGKTVTFSTVALQLIESKRGTEKFNESLVLVLSPNRELANQTHTVIEELGKFMKGINCHKTIGGYQNMSEDSRELRNQPHIIIGTMGRVKHQIELGNLKTSSIELVIIDEADEMLREVKRDSSFKEQISEIYKNYINPTTQTILVSATYTQEVIDTCDNILRKDNYLKILSEIEEVSLNGIKQYFVECGDQSIKDCVLRDLYQTISATQSVIFVNTRSSAERLKSMMTKDNWVVSVIHRDLEQSERDQVVKDFKSGKSRILIATDIFCRGIDVQRVSVVINYELSENIENYIHRIGRSGRHGRKGTSINLVSPGNEMRILKKIESHYKREVEYLPSDFAQIISTNE